MKIPKEYKHLADKAKKQGWMVYKTKNNHFKWVPPTPDKKVVISSATPSDINALHNFVQDLKHSGFNFS